MPGANRFNCADSTPVMCDTAQSNQPMLTGDSALEALRAILRSSERRPQSLSLPRQTRRNRPAS
jgi:hypothetical protein